MSVAPALSLTPTTTGSGLRPGAAGAVPVSVPSAPTEAQAGPPSLRKTAEPGELPAGRDQRPPSLIRTAAPGATGVAVRESTAACGRTTAGLGRKSNGAVRARMP